MQHFALITSENWCDPFALLHDRRSEVISCLANEVISPPLDFPPPQNHPTINPLSLRQANIPTPTAASSLTGSIRGIGDIVWICRMNSDLTAISARSAVGGLWDCHDSRHQG
jgi:hypothetical protein